MTLRNITVVNEGNIKTASGGNISSTSKFHLNKPGIKHVGFGFLLVVTLFILTHLIKFPGSVAYLKDVLEGQKTFDLQGSLSSAETYQRLDAFGQFGRKMYLQTMLTVDIVFPISMFILIFLLGKYSFQHFRINVAVENFLTSFSIGYVVFDFLENISIFILLSSFPSPHQIFASFLGYFTLLKRIGMIGALLIPSSILMIKLVVYITRKRKLRTM
jgi:hypothetical protein